MKGNKLKKFLICILILNLISMPVYSLAFDTSIDDQIRKTYNPNKIEENEDLPPLPKILNGNFDSGKNVYKTQASQKSVIQKPVQISAEKSQTNSPQKSCVTLKKGTKIYLKLQTSISDRTRRGAKVSFISQFPVSTTYYTIPSGTQFLGQIISSHKPQFTGNGGLIVISINSVILNGSVQPINASVTKANSKFIFFNNIKGRRKYICSVFKSMRPGARFLKEMMSLSGNLLGQGSSAFVAPFSFALGVLAFGGNIIISPALALFYKGESIHFTEGSNFVIKLAEDVYIYN